jgi:biotin carboxyl carrier protein
MKRFQITFKGQVYELDVEEISGSAPSVKKTAPVPTPSATPAAVPTPKVASTAAPAGGQSVLAPMPGKILAVNIKSGDAVKRGDVIFILEAMKMQNEIMASQDGKISGVSVTVGQTVSTGDALAIFA